MLVTVADRKYPDRPDPYSEALTPDDEIRYNACRSEDEVVDACRGSDVLVTYKVPITGRVLDELDSVKHVIRVGTGFDNINVRDASERDVPVSNTPGYSRHDLAAHAVTLMLSSAREIVRADRDLRTADGWGERNFVKRLRGKTLGIVGLGRVGRAVVPKARGLEMNIVAYDPYVPEDVFDLLEIERASFTDLLERSDCITVHTPLTAETNGLFSIDEFSMMKDDAIFVNTARGPIVDERALVDAIEADQLWGAGLDVFENEPPNKTPALGCDRIICSPHHGGKSVESRERCIEIVIAELRRILRGEHPEHVVNPEVYQYADSLLNPERR